MMSPVIDNRASCEIYADIRFQESSGNARLIAKTNN
jgi:hypothetical protein